uniref:Uncharacterized protein n=1 Tax=Panagrolaimus sp. PS1159 TaxID=55785 RepID=A0AC35GNZ3_9BILA
MTYIDENWQLKKLLVELIADIERGGQAAEYAVTKINDFVTEFGITMEDLNAIVTDEAAPMKAAFQKTGKHIICPCHLCSTISKHSSELYAVDKKKLPELDKLLQKVRDLLQKLKDVITLIRGRIYILEKLSISLHQSNATRWLSSLTSIESFLALTEADHALIYEELKGHVSVSKYLDLKQSKNQLQCIFNVLHPTRHLIRQFEAEKTPTLHLVVPGLAELYNHYSTIVNSDDWIEVSMKEAGRLAIKEKVPLLHDYHYYAVILDPNAKNKIESYILPDRAGNKKTVPDLMDGLKTSVYNYAVKSGKYQPPQITSAIISPYAAHIQAPEEDFMRIINSEIDR